MKTRTIMNIRPGMRSTPDAISHCGFIREVIQDAATCRHRCTRGRPHSINWLSLAAILCLLLSVIGCGPQKRDAQPVEAKVSGDTVVMVTNSPQCAALTVEPVPAEQPTFVPLTGRLVWNDDATVRVFTPFAGIVRNLLVDINQPVKRGCPLAEIQSADFSQAQSDARKAQSDFLKNERSLARQRDLFEHGAAPKKDLESAEADYAMAQAELQRSQTKLAIYGANAT